MDKTTGDINILLTDDIGTVLGVTENNGNKLASYSYDEYGNQTAGEASHIATAFGFAGEYRDSDTGYYYLRARWYDPTTAQFTSLDPKLLSTNEPYNYTAGNPLQYTDPLGESWGDVGNFFAGVGDGLSFGLSTWAINAIKPGTINTCSSAFKWGSVTGTVLSFVIPGGPIVKSVGLVAKESFGILKFALPTVSEIKNSRAITNFVLDAKAARKSEFGTWGGAPHTKWVNDAFAGNVSYEGGIYKDLHKMSKGFRKYFGVEIHHMPMDSARRYSNRGLGPSVLVTKSDHAETRTYKSLAKPLKKSEANLSTADLIRLDVRDLLNTTGG